MVKVTIELDDQTMDRLTRASDVAHVSVEEILRRQAEEVATFPALEIPNGSHRRNVAALTRPEGYYETARDAVHDRDRQRAQSYTDARNKLLALIDNTMGDMGVHGWSRADLYER